MNDAIRNGILRYLRTTGYDSSRLSDTYMCPETKPSIVQIMAWRVALSVPSHYLRNVALLFKGLLETYFSENVTKITFSIQ